MDERLIARADANYYDAWASIVATMPPGEVRERGGLQAPEMGAPVYARLGYERPTHYKTFHRPGV